MLIFQVQLLMWVPIARAWYGMENGMERKFRYGTWKMPEWNGIFQEWNGRQSFILPYQFHTRLINNIATEVFNFNIYACYLSTIAVLWLCTLRKRYTYCTIVSTLQFKCSIDVTVDDLDGFDLLFFFYFKADNLSSRKFCFLASPRKLVFAISSPFQLNFI